MVTHSLKRAVFFDMGGTLIEPFPSVGAIYADIGRRYGITASAEEIEQIFKQVFHACEDEAALVDTGKEKQWWRRLVMRVMEQMGPPDEFDAYFDEVYDYFATGEAWRVFPEVFSVLERLRTLDITLGIISNWDSRLVLLCDRLGLTPYFPTMIISACVGLAKPNPAIFTRALESARVFAPESLFVGDSVSRDYHAARSVGIEALVVDRSGKCPASIQRISDLTGLFAWL